MSGDDNSHEAQTQNQESRRGDKQSDCDGWEYRIILDDGWIQPATIVCRNGKVNLQLGAFWPSDSDQRVTAFEIRFVPGNGRPVALENRLSDSTVSDGRSGILAKDQQVKANLDDSLSGDNDRC